MVGLFMIAALIVVVVATWMGVVVDWWMANNQGWLLLTIVTLIFAAWVGNDIRKDPEWPKTEKKDDRT